MLQQAPHRAKACTVLSDSKPAVNRQPGFRREDSYRLVQDIERIKLTISIYVVYISNEITAVDVCQYDLDNF